MTSSGTARWLIRIRDEAPRLAASRKELAQFFREAAAERRSHPRADGVDIITSLVQASDDDRLSEGELVEFCLFRGVRRLPVFVEGK
jgi:cytochrome P450